MGQGPRGRGGPVDAATQRLAGCHGSNGERDLLAWVALQDWRKALPEPYDFTAPLQQKGKFVEGSLSCLLPHEVFAHLAAHVPAVFQELFGDAPALEDFWEGMQRTVVEMPPGARAQEHERWVKYHPTAMAAPKTRVPMGMHGDAGQMHFGEKVMVISWGGLAVKGSTFDTRLLFCCLKHTECVQLKSATLFRALKVMTWSFWCLAMGLWPARDPDGKPFGMNYHPDRALKAGTPLVHGPDGPLCGAWCELRGDWEFLAQALHLKNFYSCQKVCHLCPAENMPMGKEGPLQMTNFGADGPAGGPLVGPWPYGANKWESKDPISPLCRLPGFSVWRCMFDIMHTLELGILQRIVPCALQGLMGLRVGKGRPTEESAFGPGSMEAKARAATVAYKEWCEKTMVPHPNRVKVITIHWVEKQVPIIKMHHAKAAGLRAMAPWVAELAEGRAGCSEAATLRATCLRGLVDMDAVYMGAGRFLTAHESAVAEGHAWAALEALAKLVELHPDGPWAFQPKAHALLHLARDSAMANPRASHCYQDEDFVGRMKKVYTSCHGRTAPRGAIQRYAMARSASLMAREELAQGKRQAKVLPGGMPAGSLLRAGQGVQGHQPSPRPASSSSVSTLPRGVKRGSGGSVQTDPRMPNDGQGLVRPVRPRGVGRPPLPR